MIRVKNHMVVYLIAIFLVPSMITSCSAEKSISSLTKNTGMVEVDSGWARNSINTTIFRKNSLVSFGDTQFIAFYDKNAFVVVGKRKIGEKNWELKQTSFKGNVADAHNVISIMVDGDGYVHMAWDHHNNSLHYVKSLQPGSLEFGEKIQMTGKQENKVSYPEFYRMADGNLLFFYRDGGSGNGNLVINQYNLKTKEWTVLQANLIDGEGKRNAYWQACIDASGAIHISWVWRESPDVASNHDLCYARSKDGGITWEKSTGEKYHLPITAATAEIACHIAQNSELINQTSMFADASGNPYIATYWRDRNDLVPQYHLLCKRGLTWQLYDPGFRKTDFSLSGAGTKQVPVSRPQVIAWTSDNRQIVGIIFRDAERNNRPSIAICTDLEKAKWKVTDFDQNSLGSWEPTYDTELWKTKSELHLFLQKTEQVDAEGQSDLPPQMVRVLEWKPVSKN